MCKKNKRRPGHRYLSVNIWSNRLGVTWKRDWTKDNLALADILPFHASCHSGFLVLTISTSNWHHDVSLHSHA